MPNLLNKIKENIFKNKHQKEHQTMENNNTK